MRTNLITMLDGIDLPSVLNLPSSQTLFEDRRDLADSTSAICHAVLVLGRNYSGTPAIDQHLVLTAAPVRSLPTTSQSPLTPSSWRWGEQPHPG